MAPPRQASGVRLAVIDDDSGLLTVLERRWQALGWECVVRGEPVVPDELAALRIHALIVNPALSGTGYLSEVHDALPGLALLVVAAGASVAERVAGLRSGADDWLAKPCHPDELIARVEAVLRRRRGGELIESRSTIHAGELAIRADRFDAHAGERAAGLSRKEYELLALLAAAEGRVLRREEIYQSVWGYTMARGDRSVDVFVRKLRSKLDAVSPGWRYVHTHFGVGYRFAAEAPGAPDAAAGAGAADPPRRRTLVA